MNDSKRSFIVRTEDVLKGGKVSENKAEKYILGDKAIADVTDKLGKILSTYKGITVLEIVKGK